MSLQCGIFGLPNVGKSTCFNALSQAIIAEASNYPFCTIKPNRSVVPVPDPRLKALANVVHTSCIVPTTVEFVDIAGLVKNAAQGEGLGNQFLSHIREMDALIHVVRCFDDPHVMHVAGKIDPLSDIEVVDTELILSDLSLLERLRSNSQKLLKSGDKTIKNALDLLSRIEKELENGVLLRCIAWESELLAQLKKWQFLTAKPMMYLANVAEEGFSHNPLLDAVRDKANRENAQLIVSCVKLESDLIGSSEEDKRDLLAVLGDDATGLGQLIRKAHQLLGLQNFFTAGPKEVRAWTICAGSNAWEAAGRIHTDFQRGFIMAEVVDYDSFILYEGIKGAKAAGKWRTERKEYLVNDGDVILFRFNV